MLLDGFNHVAILTADTDRFVGFYEDVFEAEVAGVVDMGGAGKLTFVRVGEHSEFNVFELTGNSEPER
jgi:catechol 2,3-dioxygenase-like lactoylglutathione lyase family enzyme